MSGHPDWGSDPGFPSYGTLTQIAELETIASGNSAVLFDISAKGVLYFCHIESAVHAAYDDFTMTFVIDGFTLMEASFSTLFTTSLSGLGSFPFACFSYVPETPFLSLGLSRAFPFASQIKLSVENDDSSDIRILVRGAYAKLL